MRTPGFTAENSVYKASSRYYSRAALAKIEGVISQQFPLPVSRFPGSVTCDPVCYLDETGACVRDCTNCPPGQLPDGCQDFTRPCPLSACCPSGQYPCGSSCCPSGMACCNSVCTSTVTDPTNCGRCGNVCPPGPANSYPTCENGSCGFGCIPGYTPCDNRCCGLCTRGPHCYTDCLDRCVMINNGDPFGVCPNNCYCCCHGTPCDANGNPPGCCQIARQ